MNDLTLPNGLTRLYELYLNNNLMTSLTISPDIEDTLRLFLSDNPFLEIRLPVGFDKIQYPGVGPEDYDLVYYDPSSLVPSFP